MISTCWKSTGRVTFSLAQRLVATLTPRAPSRLVIAAGLVSDLLRPRRDLVIENALLRQQLIVASRSVKRPRVRSAEKLTLLGLCRLLPRWRNALLVIKPETIIRWHQEGFRLAWRWRSRSSASAPRVPPETIALIHRMASENALWGAERIRGELLKLGIRVAKRTVQRHMRSVRRRPGGGQRWRTFVHNHASQIWACDFLQVHDIWFRPVFALLMMRLDSREIVHVAVTRNPTQAWIAQQLRNATPFDDGPRFVLRDRDDKFGELFDGVAEGVGARILRTPVRSPRANAEVERFFGSVRRECLDHLIILGKRHLASVLGEYSLRYHNRARPHQGIGQRIPADVARATFGKIAGPVVASPCLAGFTTIIG